MRPSCCIATHTRKGSDEYPTGNALQAAPPGQSATPACSMLGIGPRRRREGGSSAINQSCSSRHSIGQDLRAARIRPFPQVCFRSVQISYGPDQQGRQFQRISQMLQGFVLSCFTLVVRKMCMCSATSIWTVLANLGPMLSTSCRMWPASGENWLTFSKIRRTLDKVD